MAKHEPPPGMATISGYSRHRGVHRSYIGRLVERGLLPHMVTPRGIKLIDIVKSDLILDDMPTTDELHGGADAEKQQTTYSQARIVKMVFDAKLSRLAYETAAAKMVDAEGVRARIAEHLDAFRQGFAAMADRLVPIVARESDAKRVHRLLRQEIIGELHRLANLIGGHATIGGPSDVTPGF